mmetsp:Transcript_84960/g.203634  ORF Transcript_84960/g.203634 Transcript_84960/m.203634 type:complete len:539 (-) Transcript_84960:195-1811(-)
MRVGHVSGTDEALPLGGNPFGFLTGLEAVSFLEGGFVLFPDRRLHCFELLWSSGAAVYQAFGIHRFGSRMLVDLLVQHRLRILWRIRLVVAEAAVANNIDDDICLPGLSPLGGELECTGDCHRVITVYMQDGKIEALAKVRGVQGGPVIHRIRGEAHLVVDDNMDSSANVKLPHVRKLQRLIANALPSKGGIPMEKDRHDARPGLCCVAQVVLLCPCSPKGDSVHCLQVRGIRLKRSKHRFPIRKLADIGCSQVIFDIACEQPIVDLTLLHNVLKVVMRALELSKHLDQRLANDIREHIQATPMRHPNDGLLDPHLGCTFDGSIDTCHCCLATVNSKTLGCLVLGVQKLLKGVNFHQLTVDLSKPFLVAGEKLRALHPRSNPVHLFEISDVHVLNSDGVAVYVSESAHDLAQGRAFVQSSEAYIKGLVHVCFRKAVIVRIQLWCTRSDAFLLPTAPAVQIERVQRGRFVSPHLVGTDEILQATCTAAGGHETRGGLSGSCCCRQARLDAKLPQRCTHSWRGCLLSSFHRSEILTPFGI